MYRIWIVEDELEISLSLKKFLESWGYQVSIAEDFQNVLETFHRLQPDLVLMDITLPYANGYLWTEKIREISKVPIIFISSARENMNIVMAISAGADDFVTKPFDLHVLLAKIQAILRRTYDFSGKTDYLEKDGLIFRIQENTIYYQGKSVELTRNEGRILQLLMRHQGKIVKRAELMDYLWQNDVFVDENALSVNVNRLRRKLASLGIEDWIHTRKGLGYQL
ncbi:Response regulator protein GraR [Clostridiales bacterium CHKCI006]|nr:Response regulator protein GraR [Clostridiales bacterium CHKCI006]